MIKFVLVKKKHRNLKSGYSPPPGHTHITHTHTHTQIRELSKAAVKFSVHFMIDDLYYCIA